MIDLPTPERLDQLMFDNLEGLKAHRRWLDTVIIHWVAALTDDDLSTTLSYHNTIGVASKRRYSNPHVHFFNHQTHHRGPVSISLSQAGGDIGVTDLLALNLDKT